MPVDLPIRFELTTADVLDAVRVWLSQEHCIYAEEITALRLGDMKTMDLDPEDDSYTVAEFVLSKWDRYT